MLLTLADRMVAYGQRQQGGGGNQKEAAELLTAVVVTLVVILFPLVIGRLIWDNVLTRLVSVVRKSESVWDILMLYILISLLFAK